MHDHKLCEPSFIAAKVLSITCSADLLFWTTHIESQNSWEIYLSYGKLNNSNEQLEMKLDSITQIETPIESTNIDASPFLTNEIVFINNQNQISILNANSHSTIQFEINSITNITNASWGFNKNEIFILGNNKDNTNTLDQFYKPNPREYNACSQVYQIIISRDDTNKPKEIMSIKQITPNDYHVQNVKPITQNFLGIVWTNNISPAEIIHQKFSIISSTYDNLKRELKSTLVANSNFCVSPNKENVAIIAWNSGVSWIGNSTIGIINILKILKENNHQQDLENFVLSPGNNQDITDILGWNSDYDIYFSESLGFSKGTLIYSHSIKNMKQEPVVVQSFSCLTSSIIVNNQIFGVLHDYLLYNRILIYSLENSKTYQLEVKSSKEKKIQYQPMALNNNNKTSFSLDFIFWKTDNDITVEAAILYPKNYDKSKKYSTLLLIHGGPDVEWKQFSIQEEGMLCSVNHLLENEWICVFPNIRGSNGYGQLYRDYVSNGNWDIPMRDILLGVEFLINYHSADINKICLFGWSYGGYLGAIALTIKYLPSLEGNDPIPFSFHKIVLGAPVINLQSQEALTCFPELFYNFFSSDDLIRFKMYKKKSPINILNISELPHKKPSVLLIHGENDTKVPINQTLELHHFLQKRNIPCTLKILRNQDHFPYYSVFPPNTWNKLRYDIINFIIE